MQRHQRIARQAQQPGDRLASKRQARTRDARTDPLVLDGAVRWSQEHYAKRYPQYNRTCVEYGAAFNALHLGSRRRITGSRAYSEAPTRQVQRENTRRYVKGEKYKAYKARYYEAVKARRCLAQIGVALASSLEKKGAEV